MEGKNLELPNSWVRVKLGDFVENEKGKKPKNESKSQTASHTIPYVDIQTFEEKVVRTWTDGIGCRLCYETDFLMVWDGSRSGLVGKGVNGALGSTLVRIYFPSMVNDYAFYFLQSKYQQINTRTKGVGIPHVDPNLLWNYDFPIAPLNEQHRIVAKIEELFSELDKGIENLKTAREQLRVYRQALLKHAFEGKLTREWRAANPDANAARGQEPRAAKLEPAAALLARIQTEREQRYRQQLQQWEPAGGGKPKAPKPLPPLTAAELAELPELPEGWGWVKLGQVFNVYVGSTPSRKRADFWNGDISWVSSGEVAFCRIKETKEKITNIGYENASTEIHPVGTVMLAMIGEGKTRGQAAILNIEATHNQNTAAIRVSESDCPPEFVYQYLVYQYEITRRIGSGNNQKALNKERVSDLILPLCSIEEQKEIVALLDACLFEADQLDQTLAASLQQAEALRQSILKKAFSGQLVAQDANDEPASVLLERIKAEKAAAMVKPRNAKQAVDPKPVQSNVIHFPVKFPNISATDLHAGILARAYQHHEHTPRYLANFGHVKAEKIVHLVEAHLGIDLGREPVKAAAGPTIFPDSLMPSPVQKK